MKDSLISVIIPVYNVEEYLNRCLTSVLQQTYQKLEIILVDDGSTDRSGAICDEYAAKDARITVLHGKNSGPGGARNAGLAEAQGRYIVFLDGDDYVTADYVEYLYLLLTENDADMAMCQLKKVYSDADKLDEYEEKVECLNAEDALRNLLCQKKIHPGVNCKIYKKEIFDKISFPMEMYYEDLATIYKILDGCGKIIIGKAQKYYYYQHQESIMNQGFSDKKMYRMKAAIDLKEYIDKRYPKLVHETSARCFIAGIQVFREIPKEKKYGEYIETAWQQIKKYRWDALKSKEMRLTTRIMALSTFMGKNVLSKLGQCYSFVFVRRT